MLITSIHAPHAGCDNPRRITSLLQMLLQSTHLHAGCDGPPVLFAHHCLQLQFTHPMRGATKKIYGWPPAPNTSIHAPHAGCDTISERSPAVSLHFNPRTPCGVRQGEVIYIYTIVLLQSTRPMRGATCCVNLYDRQVFGTSIHAPHVGCDPIISDRKYSFRYFNPRTPCGVRL